jgi:hypothetical protein
MNTITKTFQKVQLKKRAIKKAQIIVTTVSSIAISNMRYLRSPVRGIPKIFLYLQRSSIFLYIQMDIKTNEPTNLFSNMSILYYFKDN